MAVYTSIDGYRHLFHRTMSRKSQITLTDRQHAFLICESERTGLSMAELVRRAIDATYRPHRRRRVPGFDVNVGVWFSPDAAVVGRRAPRRVTD